MERRGFVQDRAPAASFASSRPSAGLSVPVGPHVAPPDSMTELTQRILDLQAAFRTLEDRIIKGERHTDRLEQEARQLVSSSEAAGSLQRNFPPDASRSAASSQNAESQQNPQLQRLLNQLETSAQRLSNQEQAIQTIAMVIQSMASSLDLPGEASSSHGGGTDAASFAMSEIREIANPSRASMSFQGNIAYLFQDGQPARQASASHAEEAHSEDVNRHMAGHEEEFPSLQRNGEQSSNGSKSHPDLCRPCAFYCFSKRGCKKGLGCEYCHMLHISRSNRRVVKSDNNNSSRRRGPSQKGSRHGMWLS